MIESISISKVATYPDLPEVMNNLSKINFIFGFNGSGKTTITRVIAHKQNNYPSCKVCWKKGKSMEILVYNRDFIEHNFNESTELKGVFTLGKKQFKVDTDIDDVKSNIKNLNEEIDLLTETLHGQNRASGKKGELDELEEQLSDKCWKQKQKYDHILKGGFEGYRNNKRKFKEKVLRHL